MILPAVVFYGGIVVSLPCTAYHWATFYWGISENKLYFLNDCPSREAENKRLPGNNSIYFPIGSTIRNGLLLIIFFALRMNEESPTVHRIAFTMKLFDGQEAEYKRRHAALWPELKDLLKKAGISDYSLFLDGTTNTLFGVLKAADMKALDNLPGNPVMQKWWAYMKEIMASNEDNSPVSVPLQEVFYLP